MIELSNLTKSFAGHTALRHVDLFIQEGEVFGIIGKSGAGKSTLLRCINLLERPDSGHVLIDGEELTALNAQELRLARHNMAMIFQQFNLLPRTSALDNVALPLLYARNGPLAHLDQQARIDHARVRLEQVGLGKRLTHTPAELSGGQQQRVAIARALVNDPVLILADEPTGALDSKTSVEVLELLTRLNQQGMTVVVVTHSLEVAAYAKRQITFRDGQIVDIQVN